MLFCWPILVYLRADQSCAYAIVLSHKLYKKIRRLHRNWRQIFDVNRLLPQFKKKKKIHNFSLLSFVRQVYLNLSHTHAVVCLHDQCWSDIIRNYNLFIYLLKHLFNIYWIFIYWLSEFLTKNVFNCWEKVRKGKTVVSVTCHLPNHLLIKFLVSSTLVL